MEELYKRYRMLVKLDWYHKNPNNKQIERFFSDMDSVSPNEECKIRTMYEKLIPHVDTFQHFKSLSVEETNERFYVHAGRNRLHVARDAAMEAVLPIQRTEIESMFNRAIRLYDVLVVQMNVDRARPIVHHMLAMNLGTTLYNIVEVIVNEPMTKTVEPVHKEKKVEWYVAACAGVVLGGIVVRCFM